MNSLNEKIVSSNNNNQDRALVAGVYGWNETVDKWNKINITDNGEMKVDLNIDESGLATETTLSALNNKINSGDGSTQTELQRNTAYGCFNNSDLRSIKVDSQGRLLTQVEGVRSSGSETLVILDGTTVESAGIQMGTHKYIAFYGDTDNTTNTNIFIEYSQDGSNWYRGAGDNAKIIVVSSTGNFYDEEHITPPRVRISRPNTSGASETLQLYYTLL